MTTAKTSVIRANLTRNSAGTDTASGGVFVPYGNLVIFDMTRSGGSGSVHAVTHMTNGSAKASLVKPSPGTWTASTTIDDETVSAGITVTALPGKVGITDGINWYLDTNGNGVWDGTPTDQYSSLQYYRAYSGYR